MLCPRCFSVCRARQSDRIPLLLINGELTTQFSRPRQKCHGHGHGHGLLLPELLNVNCGFLLLPFRINFVIATFTTSEVTDAKKFQHSLDESFRDMKHLLLTSKL